MRNSGQASGTQGRSTRRCAVLHARGRAPTRARRAASSPRSRCTRSSRRARRGAAPRRRRRRPRTARPGRPRPPRASARGSTGRIISSSASARSRRPSSAARAHGPASPRACTGRRSRGCRARSPGCSRASGSLRSKGGASSRISPPSGSTSSRCARVHRRSQRARGAAPESDGPRLRQHVDPALARPARCRAACRRRTRRAGTRRRPRRAPRPRARARRGARRSARRAPRRRARGRAARSGAARRYRKNAIQTLSPRPSRPTRFMPSFQSPVPISGSPCAPTRERAVDRAAAVLVDARALAGGLGRAGTPRPRRARAAAP